MGKKTQVAFLLGKHYPLPLGIYFVVPVATQEDVAHEIGALAVVVPADLRPEHPEDAALANLAWLLS